MSNPYIALMRDAMSRYDNMHAAELVAIYLIFRSMLYDYDSDSLNVRVVASKCKTPQLLAACFVDYLTTTIDRTKRDERIRGAMRHYERKRSIWT